MLWRRVEIVPFERRHKDIVSLKYQFFLPLFRGLRTVVADFAFKLEVFPCSPVRGYRSVSEVFDKLFSTLKAPIFQFRELPI
ncbi:hypothetical protein C6Y58_16585 [Stutzerimonas stutzeri]|uniref:Uncharacterized protein n=1 Tax=Pseudomonas songnenensis TaxID=1176259 RepID=A0ABX9UWY2_9PSED|nr:hypothetical protein C6Y58_16585 [Stutzerimonas stutzeri]RMH97914.1 hypothetical protein EA798_05715 [Pseudomonas songnenensis]